MDNSVESGGPYSAYDSESLPSYTLVSGLPSYDDALDCYRKTQVSTSSRPSIMKLFSFDNPLLVREVATNSSAELQQVVVVEPKDGLPSYQESLVMVNETQKKTNVKRSVHKPVLPLKVKNVATITAITESTTASGDEEEAKKGYQLAQIHKSPSMVLVYDDEYWRNVHQNQQQSSSGCTLAHSYSSNSLPRNFSTHLMNEA